MPDAKGWAQGKDEVVQQNMTGSVQFPSAHCERSRVCAIKMALPLRRVSS